MTRKSVLAGLLVTLAVGLAACGQVPTGVARAGSHPLALTSVAAQDHEVRSCENVPPPGRRLDVERALAPGTRLSPLSDFTAAISAAKVAEIVSSLGLRQENARCADYVLGQFIDEVSGIQSPAWVVIYSKYGRMVDGAYRTDVPPGSALKIPPQINQEMAVVVDAVSGEHVTTLEYPVSA